MRYSLVHKNFLANFLTTITLFFAIAPTLCHAKGGNSGGGGTTIQIAGKSLLLDLYLANPNTCFTHPSPAAEFLAATRALSNIHLERLALVGTERELIILNRLAIWEKSSPILTEAVKRALRSIPLYYTPYRIIKQDENRFIPESLSSAISDGELRTAALYVKSFGTLLSKPDFDSLDLLNQNALILHEVLRYIQIEYGYAMSNQSLQELTAKIMLFTPQEEETLDSPRYLGEILGLVAKIKRESPTFINEKRNIILKYKKWYPELYSAISVPEESTIPVDMQLSSLGKLLITMGAMATKAKYFEDANFLLLEAGDAATKAVDARTPTLSILLDLAEDSMIKISDAVWDLAIRDANEGRESAEASATRKYFDTLLSQKALEK